jgi:hypothetical protein
MTKEHKLYELSKELVYQMTGKYTEDVQNADFQIAWHYLSKAMDYTRCCTELCEVCNNEQVFETEDGYMADCPRCN